MAYTKLFSSIVTSTIWTEDDKTRIVWITMLALADKNGEIQASIPGLGRVAGVSVEDTEAAINKFLSPDQYSRTPDDEGRRIEKIDGGWALLNHAKYREMERDEDRRVKAAERQRRKRAKDARNDDSAKDVTPMSQPVTDSSHQIPQAEAEAEAEAEDFSHSSKNPPLPPKGDGDGKKKSSKLPVSPEAIKIAELYRRRLTTEWSDKEIKAFKALCPIDPSDLDLVIRYERNEMEKGDKGWHKRDLGTFLNQFGTELDRARAWDSQPADGKPPKKFSGHHENIEIPEL